MPIPDKHKTPEFISQLPFTYFALSPVEVATFFMFLLLQRNAIFLAFSAKLELGCLNCSMHVVNRLSCPGNGSLVLGPCTVVPGSWLPACNVYFRFCTFLAFLFSLVLSPCALAFFLFFVCFVDIFVFCRLLLHCGFLIYFVLHCAATYCCCNRKWLQFAVNKFKISQLQRKYTTWFPPEHEHWRT